MKSRASLLSARLAATGSKGTSAGMAATDVPQGYLFARLWRAQHATIMSQHRSGAIRSSAWRQWNLRLSWPIVLYRARGSRPHVIPSQKPNIKIRQQRGTQILKRMTRNKDRFTTEFELQIGCVGPISHFLNFPAQAPAHCSRISKAGHYAYHSIFLLNYFYAGFTCGVTRG